MKSSSRLAWLLGTLGATVALFACVGDDNTPVTGTPDASIPIGDSSVAIPDAAGNDANVSDAGVDVEVPDTGPLPLVVRTLDPHGFPEANVPIVINDPTGASLTPLATDATGTVSTFVASGSQVTAVFGSTTNPALVTVQAVAPGDVITLVDSSQAYGAELAEVNVTAPPTPWDAAANAGEMFAGTCYQALGYTLDVTSACAFQGEFPLLVLSTSDGNELGYTYAKDNPLDPDSGVPDGGVLSVDVSHAWATSTDVQTIAITKAPAPLDAGTGEPSEVSMQLSYAEIAEGVATRIGTVNPTMDDAGVATGTFVMHTGYPDATQVEASYTVNESDNDYFASIGVATRSSDAGAGSQSATVDLTQLPLVTMSSVDYMDAGTPERPIVSWTAVGQGTPSGVIASLQFYSQSVDDAGATSYVDGTWTILAPPGSTTVQPPAIPATYAPASTSTYQQFPLVGLVQGSIVPTYGAVRAQLGALPALFNVSEGLQFPPLPVDGTLVVSAFYPDEG